MVDKDPPDLSLAPTLANTTADGPTRPHEPAVSGPIAPGALTEPPPPVGLEFDERYAGGELLGAGGMGEVREFEDTVIGRPVAIKFLRAELSETAESHARFIREARVQGKLQHPAVVPVYDLASTESGTAFFTMKRLGGRTLAEILARARRGTTAGNGDFDTHQLLTAFADVCLAVDYAHSRGVIHRDLKPANIMLGDFGEVYVLDWGLARLVDAEVEPGESERDGGATTAEPDTDRRERISEAVGVTSGEAVLGTIGYMSPEQLYGEPLDVRADVYALGAILFELLTLEPLHDSPTNQGRAASTLEGSAHRIRAYPGEIAPELLALCLEATDLERDARTASARALYEKLEGYLAGDRDHARRVALAVDLAASAHADADDALETGDVEARRRAMATASRALALDPEQPSAPATLMRLLMSPPAETPREVLEALEANQQLKARNQSRLAIAGYLSWFIATPLFVWMGVTDWFLAAAMMVMVLFCAGLQVFCARVQAIGTGLIVAGVLANAALLFLVTRLFGPLVLTPVLAMATSLSFSLYGHRLATIGAPVTAALAIIAAVIAEAAGWLSSSYQFAGGEMRIASASLELRPPATLVTLTLLISAALLVASWLIGSIRRNLDAIEREAQMHLWQYRQLVTPVERSRPFSN